MAKKQRTSKPARASDRTRTVKFLTQPETRRLFAGIKNQRDKTLFLMAYRHGLRASEVSGLRQADVDFTKSRLFVHRLKGSISGEQFMQSDEIKLLKAYLRARPGESPALFLSNRGDPIARRTLDHLMKRYGAQAGLPKEKRHFHVLKHSIATHLLDAGADLMFVKDWLGHVNIQNTLVYSQLTSRRREEQARKIFASPRIV